MAYKKLETHGLHHFYSFIYDELLDYDKIDEFDYNKRMRLKIIRQQKNIKQKELADAVGVSPSLVSKWEKGIRQIDLETAYTIAKFLNIKIDELMEEQPDSHAYLNMDQVTLFDFKSFKKSKSYVLELIFIGTIFLLPIINIEEAEFTSLYVFIFGAVLILARIYFVFFAPKKHMKHLMQSVHVEHQFVLSKTFNTSYHFTQQILYTFSMFIFQILFISFSYSIFSPYDDAMLLSGIGVWFIISLFFFGYLLIMATVKSYPNKIKYHITNFRFKDALFHLIRGIILFQNTLFYVLVVGLSVTHDILRLTMVISVFLQCLALVLHFHNSERANAYQFDIK